VLKEYEVPINEIHLWNAFYSFVMYYVGEDNENHVTYTYSLKSITTLIDQWLQRQEIGSHARYLPFCLMEGSFPKNHIILGVEWMPVKSIGKSVLKTHTYTIATG
jgi:hypothetical protein